ncbi:retrovirus-related pol polyprotein from transposon TNT 1-94 [Tanacetum coccineum]
MRENDKEEKVKHEMEEINTINIKLEHSVAKLLSENERLHKDIGHLKKIYKDQFDLIKKTRALSKEHDDSLIAQLNSKSMENADLKRQIQDKIRALMRLNLVKKVAITPMNKVKKVRFFEPLTSSSNIKQVESSKTSDSNTHVLSYTRLKGSTSTCRSQPIGNKKNDRISQKPSSNRKNKVEAQPRKVNKKNRVKEPICDDNVKHTMLNANSQLICVKCKQCMFDSNHVLCFLIFVNDVNMHAKSKSKSKKSKVQNIWKPTGKVLTDLGLKWEPTGRLFTIVGNSCPLTRSTPNKIVPLKETTYNSVETPKPEIKVYIRRPKQIKSIGSSKKAKIVESKIANNSEPNHLWGSNATDVPSSSSLINDRLSRLFSGISGPRMFKNDTDKEPLLAHELWNIIISRVYYVEDLGHNLFSVGQFCYADLEVAIQKNTCYIWNLEAVYRLHLKTKSWLWHRRFSHLNFGTRNKLAKDGLARGIPKLKFQKDHLCSVCALGKSKKSSHQPKADDTNQEKLYLLHMDLCGPMHVESINEKKYILVIVDDYSRFTWVKFMISKDEASDAIIKCIKNIQVRLNATVRNVRIDNGTEFVSQTLRDFYENVGISHQTSVARTPQQNDVVERQNRTLVEAARTMLIFSKAPLFLWVEAINTTCYTQNRSLIRL